MPFKKHKCVKIIKCAIVAYVLLTAWFAFVNPWGCNYFHDSPLQRAKITARRLFVELEGLNVNGQNPWPPAPELIDDDAGLRRGVECSSSVAYFDWLFQMDAYGGENRNPFIQGLPISFITFDETSTRFTPDNVKWSIAEGVDEKTPDCAIVLASANLDCSYLLSSYDGNADYPKVTKDGNPAIIVKKNGNAEIFEPKYLNARYLYWRHAFSGGPKSYLTPQGRVWTKR